MIKQARQKVAGLWQMIRRLSGDDAYERYLQHHAEAHAGQTPLSRKAFFRQRQEDQWNGVKRCC